MTTSERTYSHMVIVTDSDTYFTLGPGDLSRFANMEDPVSEAFLGYKLHPASNEYVEMSGLSVPRLSVLYFAKFTGRDIIKMYEWVEEQLLSSVSAMEYKLNEIFDNNGGKKRTHYGPHPGTIRIFSKELISYYDGKNWRKVKA